MLFIWADIVTFNYLFTFFFRFSWILSQFFFTFSILRRAKQTCIHTHMCVCVHAQVCARSCSTLCYPSLPGFLCPWNFPDKDTGGACGFLFQVNLLSPGIESRCLALPTVPPGGADGKESACNVGDQGSYPWLGKNPLKRVWQPIPVFLLGESPWREEPGGLQSMGSQRVRHEWATKLITAWAHTHKYNIQTLQVYYSLK